MKKMVGRRVVDDSAPEMALVVVVHRRFWRKDEYYNEGDIGVHITGEVLQITTPSGIISYNHNSWKTVTSKRVPSRSKV